MANKIDKMFENMSKGTAEKMTGTHPPKPKTPKKAVKKGK